MFSHFFHSKPVRSIMAKRYLTLFLLLATGGARIYAQNTVLKVDTAMTTHSSGTSRFSALFEPAGNAFGFPMAQSAGNWVAEDFIIPPSTTWAIDSIIVYGYQTQATANTTSTFTGGYAMLYNGVPGAISTMVVGGDSTTNRFANSSYTGIQRVDTITNTTGVFGGGYRLIMRVAMTGFSNILAAGNYWLAWSTTGSVSSGPWANLKVVAGTPSPTNPTSQNGRIRGANAVWAAVRDSLTASTPGQAVGFNFLLKGRINPTSVKDVSATAFTLAAPFPNPASGTTNISFSLRNKSRVSVYIVNAAGQRVANVVEDEMTAGDYLIPFSTASLASGNYRVTLQAEGGSTAMPLTVK
jgi:hypothetical protein